MKKVLLYIAASIDNFIARGNGDVDWLDNPDFAIPDEDYGYKDFYKSVDITLMGHNTYKGILGFNIPFPYPEKTNYVFCRSNTPTDTEHVSFINGDIVDFVKELKKEDGGDIWLVGGGMINTILLENGLIDTIILTIIPICLGDGIPLFQRSGHEVSFNLESCRTYSSGLVQLTWTKKVN